MSNSKSEDTPTHMHIWSGVGRDAYCLGCLNERSEPPQDTSLDDKATQHTHKWSHVSKAWEHCSGCDKWRSTSDAK